jgi:hypothetical protein
LTSQGTTSHKASLGKHSRTSSTDEDHEKISPHGEAHVTASVGSNEGLAYLDEDLMRNMESRLTGYLGQNSEVKWLSSVQRQTEHTGAEPLNTPYGPPGSGQNAISARSDALQERRGNASKHSTQGSLKHITDSTFYVDNEYLDFDMIVDPDEDPEPDVAERLFHCYLETVHPSVPLVRAPARNKQSQFVTFAYFLLLMSGTHVF